jgi:hypothetical protein
VNRFSYYSKTHFLSNVIRYCYLETQVAGPTCGRTGETSTNCFPARADILDKALAAYVQECDARCNEYDRQQNNAGDTFQHPHSNSPFSATHCGTSRGNLEEQSIILSSFLVKNQGILFFIFPFLYFFMITRKQNFGNFVTLIFIFYNLWPCIDFTGRDPFFF